MGKFLCQRWNSRQQAKVLLEIAHERTLYHIGKSSSPNEIKACKDVLSSITQSIQLLCILIDDFTLKEHMGKK